MALELAYPHIEKPEGQPARLQRLPRVRVAQIVMDYLAYGWSADEMCRPSTPISNWPRRTRPWGITSTTRTRLTARSGWNGSKPSGRVAGAERQRAPGLRHRG